MRQNSTQSNTYIIIPLRLVVYGTKAEKRHEKKNHTPNEGNVVFRILMIKSKSDSEIKPQLEPQQFQQLELQEQQPLPLVQKTCENGE